MVRKKLQKLVKTVRILQGKSTFKVLVFIGVFGVAGASLLFVSHAATPNGSIEAEDGQRTNNAIVVDDPTASNGKAVRLGQSSTLHTPPLPPSGKVITGIVRGNRSTETRAESIECAEFGISKPGTTYCPKIETDAVGIGRKYSIDRQFYQWWSTEPDGKTTAEITDLYNASKISIDLKAGGYVTWTSAQARYPMINLIARRADRSLVRWADISSGRYDSYLRLLAQQIHSWGRPAYFVFHHEPESAACDFGGLQACADTINYAGSMADYALAWQHIWNLFTNDEHVDNLSYVWDVVPYNARRAGNNFDSLYPGDQYIDWIAGTPFNTYDSACNWQDLSTLIDYSPPNSPNDTSKSFYQWAKTKHPSKPISLAAYGTDEFYIDHCPNGSSATISDLKINSVQYNSSMGLPTKTQWIVNARNQLKSDYPNVKMLIYFDVPKGAPTSDTPRDNRVDTSSAAYATYKDFVNDNYYSP